MNRLSLYLGLILSRSLLTALYFRHIISHASEWVLSIRCIKMSVFSFSRLQFPDLIFQSFWLKIWMFAHSVGNLFTPCQIYTDRLLLFVVTSVLVSVCCCFYVSARLLTAMKRLSDVYHITLRTSFLIGFDGSAFSGLQPKPYRHNLAR